MYGNLRPYWQRIPAILRQLYPSNIPGNLNIGSGPLFRQLSLATTHRLQFAIIRPAAVAGRYTTKSKPAAAFASSIRSECIPCDSYHLTLRDYLLACKHRSCRPKLTFVSACGASNRLPTRIQPLHRSPLHSC